MREKELSAADAAILQTPEGRLACFESQLSYLIYCCEHEHGRARRSATKCRQALIRKAEQLELSADRNEFTLGRALRERAAAIPERGRGRPSGTTKNPARVALDVLIRPLQDELRERGRADLADTLLDPGLEDGGAPAGLSTVAGILQGLELGSRDEIRRAVMSRRRIERRRRAELNRKI